MIQKISRRRFIGWIGAAGTAAFLPKQLLASNSEWTKISIFHTTDLHGNILPTTSYDGEGDLGGFARCASQIRL
jgi:2',3'-cyclic-nucleotide 2'-phosphodiesterase (5'-nucleotidase family)